MEQVRPTITIIDDDESVRKALHRLFRSAGMDAETFASAEEYLASAGRGPSACLVLDVWMLGISGLELQRRLAASGRPIPIVFITAREDEQTRRTALEAGALGFLQKPFDDRLLLDAVSKALPNGDVK